MACGTMRLDYVLKINRHHNWQGLSDDHLTYKRKTITTSTFSQLLCLNSGPKTCNNNIHDSLQLLIR